MRTAELARLLAALLVAVAGPAAAAAESPCGAQVEVRSGDTLSRIAARCSVSPQALMEANAGVLRDPNVVPLGARLAIPGAREDVTGALAEPPPEGGGVTPVATFPERAPAGGEVALYATNLPPDVDVLIGGGPNPQTPIFFARAHTTADGVLAARVLLPAWAAKGARFHMVVETPVGGPWLRASAVEVGPAP